MIHKNIVDDSISSEAGFSFLLFSFHHPWLAAWPESEDDRGSSEKIPVL